ncbi:hypothetical protein H6P81_012887 [Aristolochia fimbriata]|uniref:Uncharacterized protein n=1 Tax=Aristolochia fimbriata TaxID=158543 RepID=A0AAV7EDP1_ARIFI|nr:hypothetical protein H6P81_012887 [Aristolochia fimbriata]
MYYYNPIPYYPMLEEALSSPLRLNGEQGSTTAIARFAGVILVHSGRRLCWGFSRAGTVSALPSPTTSPVAPANREAFRLNGEQGSATATARPARAIPVTLSGSFSPGTGFAVKNLQKKRELGRTLERATLGR